MGNIRDAASTWILILLRGCEQRLTFTVKPAGCSGKTDGAPRLELVDESTQS